MSQITVQCRLVASEPTRKALWQLMTHKNTPLINELLVQVAEHSDFKTWRKRGQLETGVVGKLCQTLKQDPRFSEQPGRFYTSAIAVVEYIYRSWLKLQQRLERRLENKNRWLAMLKSDEELAELAGVGIEQIQAKAEEILATKQENHSRTRFQDIYALYDQTNDNLSACAIRFLLKNACKIPIKSEDPEKFAYRRRKVEIQIERLAKQLEERFPKGRDLSGEIALKALTSVTTFAPEDNTEAKLLQDKLLTRSIAVPFPVAFETNEDLKWSKNEKGRLCVKFNGLGKHSFDVYCDQRHLKWFERFHEDQTLKKIGKGQHSSALFTLRSGRIAWQEGKGKGEPWNVHRLILYCTVDTRFWTEEGTQLIRQEKAIELEKNRLRMRPELTFEFFFRTRCLESFLNIWQVITSYRIIRFLEKNEPKKAQKDFLAALKRTESSLNKLNQSFDRPDQPLYKGQSHIIAGVSMRMDKPATVAIVDVTTGKVLTYRSIKQLLDKNYPLLDRQRKQQQRNSHKRHKAQKLATDDCFGESELGQYIDRLLAKEIVSLAKSYQAGSIAVPKLSEMREILQAEIQARAEEKIPGYVDGQKKYARRYSVNVHRWSYGRLIENIKSQASKLNISIEEGQQLARGQPQEQALALALSAYNSRTSS